MDNDKKKVNCPHVSECSDFDNCNCGSCRNNNSVKPNNRNKQKNPFIPFLIGICAVFGIGGCAYGLQFIFEIILGLSAPLSAVITFFVIIIGSSALAIVYLERRSKNEQKRHS